MDQASIEQLSKARERIKSLAGSLHIEQLEERIALLEEQSAQPDFWQDAQAAQPIMEELAEAKETIESFKQAKGALDDAAAAFELAQTDESFEQEALHLLSQAQSSMQELEVAQWFGGEFDHGDCIVSINPGQGGLEAQDWTQMLFKMYNTYAERKGWKVQILDAPPGPVIGLDRAIMRVSGKNAYGMLKGEQGVHRLVRISPTDAKKRRQTTFGGVEVLPVLPEDTEVEIDPQDLRIDVFHASGPGGQGVNTTDSAVRITHLPTGTVVSCQNERSQLQNKAAAMLILRARLYALEQQKREEKLEELRGPKNDISWGNQIRNYILYPFQLVKDVRTEYETGNVEDILDEGNLDPFIYAYLRKASK